MGKIQLFNSEFYVGNYIVSYIYCLFFLICSEIFNIKYYVYTALAMMEIRTIINSKHNSIIINYIHFIVLLLLIDNSIIKYPIYILLLLVELIMIEKRKLGFPPLLINTTLNRNIPETEIVILDKNNNPIGHEKTQLYITKKMVEDINNKTIHINDKKGNFTKFDVIYTKTNKLLK